jgi:Xaa-Pro aminopeptidase
MTTRQLTAARIRGLFSHRDFSRVPAVLITEQPDIFYFTGFTGHDAWAVLTPKKSFLITDGRYDIQARDESSQCRIIVRRGPMTDVLREMFSANRIRRCGFIDELVTVSVFNRLCDRLRPTKFVALSRSAIYAMRQIKTIDELACIRKALRIAESAFRATVPAIRVGATEQDIAAELDYRMRLAGSEKPAFDTIVACGANAAKPHAAVSRTKITAGKSIVIDFGARFGQYCCDLTRTVWVGKMARPFSEVYSLCLDAQMVAIDALKPGMTCAEADRIARDVIDAGGYGEKFVHSLGHGFGLKEHEPPTLSSAAPKEMILQPGMVVTVEPGVYLPGVGGVRIEDDVLITERGCRRLSTLERGIDDVVL